MPAGEEGKKSLRDLLTLNVAQQCTFSDDGNKGTTYISNGKVRGDFTTMVDGKSMEGHMIMSDNTNYFWTDASSTGFKMAIGETAESSMMGKGDVASESIDIDKKGNYSCSSWVATESTFALPSGIEFTDLSQMMQNINLAQ